MHVVETHIYIYKGPAESGYGLGRSIVTMVQPSEPTTPSEQLSKRAYRRFRGSGEDVDVQRNELLTQNKILEKEASPLAKEANQYSEAAPYETKHGVDL